MLSETVNSYSEYRQLEPPDDRQSLFFLLSEVAEMVQAWQETTTHPFTRAEVELLLQLRRLGEVAENIVSAEREWVRNGDRNKPHNLRFEVGDVLMMLTRFSMAAGCGDPADCMTDKMQSKGWKP